VLRRIFARKREGDWRRLHNEELHNFYFSPKLIKVIKSTMRWVGHVARMGEMQNAYSIVDGQPEGARPLEDVCTDRNIIE
jgi:hypothetical protein